jgi:hypothetical protein
MSDESNCSLTHPALLKKLERQLSHLLMHLGAVDGGGVAADVQDATAVRVAFGQKCVVADLAGKDRQLCSLDELRVTPRVGREGSYFVSLSHDDGDGDVDLAQSCFGEAA